MVKVRSTSPTLMSNVRAEGKGGCALTATTTTDCFSLLLQPAANVPSRSSNTRVVEVGIRVVFRIGKLTCIG